MRIDKLLWSIRLFKTRSQATLACKNELIKLNEAFVKPSAKIAEGDIVSIYKTPIWHDYHIKEVIDKRVSATIAINCYEEVTPEERIQERDKYLEEKRFYSDKN